MDEMLNKVGDLINDYLTRMPVAMMIDMPEGTQVPNIRCTEESPVLRLYILMAAISPVVVEMVRHCGGLEEFEFEGFIDGVLELVKEDALEALGIGEGASGDGTGDAE